MNIKFSVTILNKYKKLALSLLLLATLATTTACSGGGSSSPAANVDNPPLLSGVFVDGPVEGLDYKTTDENGTETMSGITDENGTFMYHDGETVTFMIGDLMLGSALGNDMITPIDLVPGAMNETDPTTDPTVTNICRLLQSLDWDGDLSNGIMIPDTMPSTISNMIKMIDFPQDVSAFNDNDLQIFFDTMNNLGGRLKNGGYRELMTPAEAQDNFQQTLMNHMEYMHSINPSWTPQPGNMMTGVFVDGPVEGLDYKTTDENGTETMSGITDENGTFKYHEGETVTFMIGDLMLGSALGNDMITPIDLVPGAMNETDPTTDTTVTNICRLLQSLDWDGDLSNGIMITDAMRSEISGRMIDFTKDVSTFNDYDVQAFFDTMNMLGDFPNVEYRALMTPADAQYNFEQTLMNHMDYMNSINASWTPSQSGNTMNGISQDTSGSTMYGQGGGMMQ